MNPLSLGVRTQFLVVGGGSGPKTLILTPCRRKTDESFEFEGASASFGRRGEVAAVDEYFAALTPFKIGVRTQFWGV